MKHGILATLLVALASSCHTQHTLVSHKEGSPMSKHVLIIATSHSQKGSTGETTGAYIPEISHPYDAFIEAGFTVEFASVKGGTVPLDGIDRKDASIAKFMDNAALMQQLNTSKKPDDVVDNTYDAVFYAGGHGTMWDFPDEPKLARLAARTYERGGVVGAVCHGPAGLVNVKLSNGAYLVAGKDASAFTDEEERASGLENVVPFLLESKLRERGATMHPGPMWQKQVVTSERLVTGQNPASARGVADAMIALLRK
jgi:putative intracellular protease/amidase